MKILYYIIYFIFFCSLYSCSDRNTSLCSELAAADSLMMTDPQGALDILSGIDSAEIGRMDREDRAFHTLLMMEAEYKNYLPVAEDTAVSEAVSYYRRRGPEELLARALVMQGAVLSERGDAEGAMLAYKEAEPLVERMGDMEQLGLLHTRIAELYQISLVNSESAIDRYRKALDCFEKAELPERIVFANIALARMLMIDSMDKAIPHLEMALHMSEQYGMRIPGLNAMDLIYYMYEPEYNAREIINLTRKVFSLYGNVPQNTVEKTIYNAMWYKAARAYINLRKSDSAMILIESIQPNDKIDSIHLYTLYKDIAALENDSEKMQRYQENVHRIELSILEEGYESQLRDSELRYDHSRLEAKLYKRDRGILFLILICILAVATSYTIIHFLRKILRRQRFETEKQKALAEDFRITATGLQKELDSQKSENIILSQEKRREEEERKKLEQILLKRTSFNTELMRYYNMTYNTMREIIDIYDIHQSNPRHLLDKSVTVARKFISDTNSYGNAKSIINSLYPGFLDKLFSEFPKLSKEEKYLLILTCLGYSTSIVSSIIGISETNISTKKTRLAQKMKIDKSLTKYLCGRLTTYQQEDAQN